MKRIISLFIIGAVALTLSFALVSCTDGEEDSKPAIIVGDDENEGEWDADDEDYSYTTEYELGGIPLE